MSEAQKKKICLMDKIEFNNCILYQGDCLEVLKDFEYKPHSCVTDPPYHLTSITKRYGDMTSEDKGIVAERMRTRADGMARLARGFMGQKWDGGDISFNPETWEAVLNVLLPGAHLLSFAGTRTYHRIACAIEDAGFEIRDMVAWLYGQGFPKSLDISKAIDGTVTLGKSNTKALREVNETRPGEAYIRKQTNNNGIVGTENKGPSVKRDTPVTDEAKRWNGWGTAFKPAMEPICFARKPLGEKTVAQNVLKYGTGGLNIDDCRVSVDNEKLGGGMVSRGHPSGQIHEGWNRPWMQDEENTSKKKLESAERVQKAEQLGRWPANIVHDGSEEVLACFPETQSGILKGYYEKRHGVVYGKFKGNTLKEYDNNKGSAARFFYCAKASTKEREEGLTNFKKEQQDLSRSPEQKAMNDGEGNPYNRGVKPRYNHHPTVKPIDLMSYFCRLVTPPGGIVLDPFMGSGTTGIAALNEGFKFIGIEQNKEYFDIAVARIKHSQKGRLF